MFFCCLDSSSQLEWDMRALTHNSIRCKTLIKIFIATNCQLGNCLLPSPTVHLFAFFSLSLSLSIFVIVYGFALSIEIQTEANWAGLRIDDRQTRTSDQTLRDMTQTDRQTKRDRKGRGSERDRLPETHSTQLNSTRLVCRPPPHRKQFANCQRQLGERK